MNISSWFFIIYLLQFIWIESCKYFSRSFLPDNMFARQNVLLCAHTITSAILSGSKPSRLIIKSISFAQRCRLASFAPNSGVCFWISSSKNLANIYGSLFSWNHLSFGFSFSVLRKLRLLFFLYISFLSSWLFSSGGEKVLSHSPSMNFRLFTFKTLLSTYFAVNLYIILEFK